MELLEILNEFKYNNIIILDDENYFEPIIETFIDESCPMYESLIQSGGKAILKKKISECDPEMQGKLKQYFYNPYSSIVEIKENLNISYYTSLGEYNSNKIDFEDEQYDSNILWFVDIKMEGMDYSHIAKLYKDFEDRIKNKHKNDIFILFSSLASQYNSLEKLKKFLVCEVNIQSSDDMCVELNTNILEKNIINSKMIYSLILKSSKSKYFNLLKKTIDESLNEFKESIYDSEKNLNLFHYDYLTEGKSFDNFLFDVFQYELKCKYVKKLDYSLFFHMNSAIDFYIKRKENVLQKDKVFWRIAKLINCIDFPVVLDDRVNCLHHDISFGDVFEFEDKFFMIANQSCDIAIRDTGDRKDFNAILVPLVFKKLKNDNVDSFKVGSINKLLSLENLKNEDKDEIKNKVEEKFNVKLKKGNFDSSNFIIKYNDNKYTLDFDRKGYMVTFPFWCLDDVACNEHGCVNFTYKTDGLRYPLKKRIEKAKEEYDKIVSNINNIDLWVFLSSAFFSQQSLKTIKRLGKLDYNIANYIHREFIEKQTRIAIDDIVKLDIK